MVSESYLSIKFSKSVLLWNTILHSKYIAEILNKLQIFNKSF